jgi:glutathione synthase/RimK-type ligase-like ATP-grasp enzyme
MIMPKKEKTNTLGRIRMKTFSLFKYLIKLKPLFKDLPQPIKTPIQKILYKNDKYVKKLWEGRNHHPAAELSSTYESPYPWTLGIVSEFTNSHSHFVGACRDLKVTYKVLDISGPNWIDVIHESGCDAFLVRPSVEITIWKQMYDERIDVLSNELNQLVYPSENSLWIYESKRRMSYWLQANDVPHPKSWVFYDYKSAKDFALEADLPIVVKSDFGSESIGVEICRTRKSLLKSVKKYFTKGLARPLFDARDIQWGNILFQEFIPHAKEWRIIRLGDSFFAHQKLIKGEFHSGSGQVAWVTPPRALLDLAMDITRKGEFRSIDIDVFETEDSTYLVNELQAFFGSFLPYQMLVDGEPGRYLFNQMTDEWNFEKGIFNNNGSCNLRVEDLMNILKIRDKKIENRK